MLSDKFVVIKSFGTLMIDSSISSDNKGCSGFCNKFDQCRGGIGCYCINRLIKNGVITGVQYGNKENDKV